MTFRTGTYFYDLNTRINSRQQKNQSFLSGILARSFNINDSFVNIYGNALGNFMEPYFSDKLFSNPYMIHSATTTVWVSDFVSFNGIQAFKFQPKSMTSNDYLGDETSRANYGVNNIYYSFNPGKIKPITRFWNTGRSTHQKYAKRICEIVSGRPADITRKTRVVEYGDFGWVISIRFGQDGNLCLWRWNNPSFRPLWIGFIKRPNHRSLASSEAINWNHIQI